MRDPSRTRERATALSMAAEDIIEAYAYRFKIEAMFREMKQQLGGFCYHFWTHAVPKLDHYRRKGSSNPLEQVKDSHQRKRIIKTFKAIEEYVMFSCIAMGIIQLLCLEYQDDIQVSDFWYLRTPPYKVMSETSTMEYLRRDLFRFMTRQGNLTITKIIFDKQVSLKTEAFDQLISSENF